MPSDSFTTNQDFPNRGVSLLQSEEGWALRRVAGPCVHLESKCMFASFLQPKLPGVLSKLTCSRAVLALTVVVVGTEGKSRGGLVAPVATLPA